jgi:hypothetical protein
VWQRLLPQWMVVMLLVRLDADDKKIVNVNETMLISKLTLWIVNVNIGNTDTLMGCWLC